MKYYHKLTQLRYAFLLIIGLGIVSCDSTTSVEQPKVNLPTNSFKTENLVIIVIDGPRFQETWGDPLKSNIPYFANELAQVGVHYNNFYNKGATYTTSGHTAITTGNYQWMANDGTETPLYPSVFQLYLEKYQLEPIKAQIITSKSKLGILTDCSEPHWRSRFNPTKHAEDREDLETFETALDIFKSDYPKMTLIHFRGPDYYGHHNQWDNYLNSITETDAYTYSIWEYLQSDPFYRGKTTLLVTNDHGRHSDQVKDGFISHGDLCEGCMHINLFAAGPDFHTNRSIDHPRESVDIAATVAYLMRFELPDASGEVMWELFK